MYETSHPIVSARGGKATQWDTLLLIFMQFKLQHRVRDFLLKLSKNWNSPSVRPITRPIRQVRVQNLLLSGPVHRIMHI
jgi:hypothetical protein